MKLKEALTIAHILRPPIWGEQTKLMCDVFDYAVRVVLGQRIDLKNPCNLLCWSYFDEAQVTLWPKKISSVYFGFKSINLTS